MYMDSINSDNNFYALSSFGNVLICSDSISNPKTVTFPNGYNLDTNLAFKVVFVNGHNCVDDSTPMTLNGVPVVVNKFGTLIPLPIHEMDESGTTVYKSVMPNCVLEMYYTSNYDGNNNPAFVVIGNPVVLSSTDYTIYADGKIGDEFIGDVKSGLYKNEPYGWKKCNGQTLSRANYKELVNFITTNNLIEQTTGDGKPFGRGDGSTTFTLPNLNGKFLEGTSTSSSIGTSIQAGIPNITASVYSGNNGATFNSSSGAIGLSTPINYRLHYDSEANPSYISLSFNARSGETKTNGTVKTSNEYHVYGSSDTVQPPATLVNYLIKVL